MRAVFIALFFSLLCGRAGAHFTEPHLLGEGARPFTQATTPGEARGFKDERLGLTEETQSKVLWAGWLPVMEERTRTVSGITGVTTRRWFQWGADLSGTLDGAGGIGGLVGIIEEDGAGVVTRTLLPVQDGLGNITAVIDQATGRTVARYDYGPFGEPLAESGEVDACPFRWQTKWYDAESQHYYFGYRHYDPRFGRWLSRDPLGEAGGFNLYAYCGNDPVNRHDPLGLASEPSLDGIKGIFEKIFEFFLVDPVKIEGDKELSKLKDRLAPPRVLEISKRNPFYRAQGWSTIKAEQARIRVEEVEGLRPDGYAEAVLAQFINDSRAAIPIRKERFAGLNAEQSRFEQEVNFALIVVTLGRSGLPLLRDALASEGPALKYHYTTAPESSFQTGLWRDSSVTDKLYINAVEAGQKLGIPTPNKVIPIQDAGHFVPNKPSIVQPSNRYQGGGTDFVNPNPVPPEAILPARPF